MKLTSIKSNKSHIEATEELLLKNFLADSRPWVVSLSGGKDSTLTLQLVYELLLRLPKDRRKPIHIVSSDTRVEPPNIIDYLSSNLQRIADHADKSDLDINVQLVRPSPEQSFWGNLIGKGYPPPTRCFRWCTTKMKIKPVRKIIDDVTAQHGSVILLLGTRKDESASRSRRIQNREYSARGLNPHHEIPNALVLQPIKDWSTQQVWEYLMINNPSPWGVNHDTMMELYRNANSGECPVITDLETPPCGGNRFGCWTCTVVKDDKSMKGFIDSGEKWMEPLYQYRKWLKEIREDESLRNSYRRNGKPGLGPFNSETRKLILEKLLTIEQQLNLRLIENDELLYIQTIWNEEFDVLESALKMAYRFGRIPKKEAS